MCQLHPQSSLEDLIRSFFSLYATWLWPQPVRLTKEADLHGLYDDLVWQPNSTHLMPILTPGYPSQNTAVNVTTSSLQTLIREFLNAESLLSRSLNPTELWKFPPFFLLYSNYIKITIKTDKEEEYPSWKGCCETQ